MSTTFGVYKRKVNITLEDDDLPKYDDEGNSINTEDDFIEVFFRGHGYCWFTNDLAEYLRDNLKVYPLDNTAQGIYTIGDCKIELYEHLNRE